MCAGHCAQLPVPQSYHLVVQPTAHFPCCLLTSTTCTDYFCEINVLATVRNFLHHCPAFWSSDQLLRSFTQGGVVLQLDPQFFAQVRT